MEFDYIGKHCSLPTCNQKDFLPFKCDHCHRDFCLEHRSYACHGCEGAESKDFTSTDCPMCGKSIRFAKSQDPNLIWEDHYLHGCTQKTQQKEHKKCARSDCRTILGPSNTFACSKCRQMVCISHRFPEEHNCANALREARANALQAKFTPTTNKTTVTKSVPSSSSVGAKKLAELSNENSLRGSAARRIAVQNNSVPTQNSVKIPTTAAPASNSISQQTSASTSQHSSVSSPSTMQSPESQSCPFLCGYSCFSAEDLTQHIQNSHSEGSHYVSHEAPAGTEMVIHYSSVF